MSVMESGLWSVEYVSHLSETTTAVSTTTETTTQEQTGNSIVHNHQTTR